MKKPIQKCAIVLGSLALLIFSVSFYLYMIQDRKIFNHNPLPSDFKFTSNYPFKEVFLETPDHAVLHGLHYRIPGAKGVVLYFHGKGGNADTDGNRVAKDFASRGHDVFIIDYRGFGKSRGNFSFPSLLSDAKLFYSYLLENYSEDQITVFGRSLGTGIATYISSINTPARLILEAPYFSIQDLAASTFPIFPRILIPYILKYPIRTDLWIQRVKCPIHIFHGTKDRLIGYDASTRLHRLIQHRTHATLTLIQGGTHSTISSHPIFQASLDTILSLP
jgi:uncharacterized protein